MQFLRNYVNWKQNTYKVAEAHTVLGVLHNSEPFNEEEILIHFQKAVELEPKNDRYKRNLNWIKNKIQTKSIIGDAFVIAPEILAILDRHKKPCQVIKKFLYSEPEIENEDIHYVFGLNNTKNVKLPKEIKKLEVLFDYMDYKPNYILSEPEELKEDLVLEDSFNLPDFKSLEEMYPEDYKMIVTYFKKTFPKAYPNDNDPYYGKAYDQLIKKYLGHDLHPTFIGGNINQMYVCLYDYEEYNFLMQYQTYWGNGDIVFVFNKKDNPTDLKIMVHH